MRFQVRSDADMKKLGRSIGAQLQAGQVFELIGDVGAGKTTFTKGLAEGLGVTEPVQSPTFTISRVYAARDGLELRHYDFYRLSEAGIMADELKEALASPGTVTVVEWSGAVESVLPEDRLRLRITATAEDAREVEAAALGERSRAFLGELTW